MKTDDDKLIIAYIVYGLIIIIIKIAILVWLYKLGYLFHYFVFILVTSLIYIIFALVTGFGDGKNIKNDNEKDNAIKDIAAEKLEKEINEDKIIQKDASEALKVVENLSVDDKNLDKSETLPSEKQTWTKVYLET